MFSEHYSFLKDVYLTVAVNSDYPCISSQDFVAFIIECDLLDSHLTLGIVETEFIASRVDTEKRNLKVPG